MMCGVSSDTSLYLVTEGINRKEELL